MKGFFSRTWLTLVIVSLCASACREGSSSGEKWGNIPREQWEITAPTDYPEATAVVVFDVGSVEIPKPLPSALIRFERHCRIKIFSKAGADEAAKVEFWLYKDDNLKGFKAQTILKTGKKISVGGKDIFKKDFNEELQLVTFTFPAVEDSCFLEYQYQITHQRYSFLDPWYFQSNEYTLKSQFSVTLLAGLTYSTVLSNVPVELRQPKQEEMVTIDGDAKKFTWTLADLYPVETEPYMAAVNTYRAALTCQLNSYNDAYNHIEFIEGWRALGKKLGSDYEEFSESQSGVKETANNLVSSSLSPKEKVQKLYEFVRDQIQTRDDDMLNFSKDARAEKVLKQKSGSAVEKNLLLIEMLRAVGITAYPLAIGTRDYAVFNPKIYHLRQFDLAACYVDLGSEILVLDTRDRWVPFPYLPPDDLVSGGLLINGDSSKPVTLTYPERQSSKHTFNRISTKRDGGATCSTRVCLSGYLLPRYHKLLQGKPTVKEVMELLFNKSENQFELIDLKRSEGMSGDSVAIELVMQIPSFASSAGQQLIFPMDAFSGIENPFKKSRRFFPVDFNFPYTVTDETELNFGEGITLSAAPQDFSEKIPGISFSRTSFTTSNSVRVISEMTIVKTLFDPMSYPELRGLFEKVAAKSSEPVIATVN